MPTSRLLLLCFALLATTARAERPFFVFDNGVTDIRSPEEQAVLLKELGYDGICTRPKSASDELFAAFDKHGVGILATYVVVPANGAALSEQVTEHIGSLKGRGTIIWLGLTNAKATDEKAATTIRNVCDLAKANGLEVTLYPHVGFHTDTIERCDHLRKLADRTQLGISFTLCHFLAQNDAAKLEATIKSIAPHLKLVQLSGANHIPPGKPDWNQLIQPLGKGDFDMARVFRTLDEIGYEGPVNLQCYKIDQPAREHLSQSMKAWKTYNTRESSK